MQMNEHHLQNETDWISNLLHIFCPQRMKKERMREKSLPAYKLWDISLAFDQMNYGIFSLMNHGNIIENGEKICIRQSIWEMTLMGWRRHTSWVGADWALNLLNYSINHMIF